MVAGYLLRRPPKEFLAASDAATDDFHSGFCDVEGSAAFGRVAGGAPRKRSRSPNPPAATTLETLPGNQ